MVASATGNLDWLFWLIGGTIAAGALALLLWSLFWDRSRGRRRCPKCWYDMAGVPGLTCPECGRASRHEKQLRRTRRHPRWATFAIATVSLGLAVTAVPRYQARGWLSFVPSTALVLFAPIDEPIVPVFNVSYQTGPAGWIAGSPPVAPVTPPTTTAQDLCEELWKRLRAGDMAAWQERFALHRYLDRQRAACIAAVTVPPRWPVGQPLTVRIGSMPLDRLFGADTKVRVEGGGQPVSWLGGWRDQLWSLAIGQIGPPAAGDTSVTFSIMGRSPKASSQVSFSFPLRVAGDLATFLDHADSPEADNAVRRALNPRFVDVGNGAWRLVFNDRSPGPPWDAIDFSIAYGFEIVVGGRTVGTGSDFAVWLADSTAQWVQPAVKWIKDGQAMAMATNANPEIVVTADPLRAGERYTVYPFGRPTACWAGTFRMPLVKGEKPW